MGCIGGALLHNRPLPFLHGPLWIECAMTPSLSPETREAGRAYLLDMIAELIKFARGSGETEVAILLKAILEVVRESERRRSN